MTTKSDEQLAELPTNETDLLLRYAEGERYFEGLQLRGAQLRGAQLEEINFRRADLTGADLRGANLARAALDSVDLARANLRGANLAEASMVDVELVGASLRDADLRGAYLEWASIVQVDLTGSLLEGACFPNARLVQVDLSGVHPGADFTGAFIDMVRLGPIHRLAESLTLPLCEWKRVTFRGVFDPGRYRNDLDYWIIRKKEESIFQAYARSRRAWSQELTIEFREKIWGALFPIDLALNLALMEFESTRTADRLVVRLRDEAQLQRALDTLVPFLAGLEAVAPGEVAMVRTSSGPDELQADEVQELLHQVIKRLEAQGERLKAQGEALEDLRTTPLEELAAGAAGTVPIAGSFLAAAMREALKANRERVERFVAARRIFSAATEIRRIEARPSDGKPAA